MDSYLNNLPAYVDQIQAIKETILANIVLLGQIPAPTFKEKNRSQAFLDRLAEFQVDQCTTDGYRNPIGVIRGTDESKPPIFVVAHLDTFFPRDGDHNFKIKKDSITGAGLTDNSLGVGVLVSLPEIGIKGNSHMLMQDRNSLEVAEWLAGWLERTLGERRRSGSP